MPKLKPQHQKFVEEIAKGKNQTQAYMIAYPNASYGTARMAATNLIAKPNISDAAQKRIEKALANSGVTLEEVVGSAARQMRYSMDDVLDENGDFDIEKARENGAIDFLKKKKTTIITDKFGNTTKTVDVEFLTNETGRKELANYLGLERFNSAEKESIESIAQIFALFCAFCESTPLTPELQSRLIAFCANSKGFNLEAFTQAVEERKASILKAAENTANAPETLAND